VSGALRLWALLKKVAASRPQLSRSAFFIRYLNLVQINEIIF
jgi:hypothetical protein